MLPLLPTSAKRESFLSGSHISAVFARFSGLFPPLGSLVAYPVGITVPSNTDLRLTTKTGDIRVTGISGQMHLGSESGSILVQQGILRGTSWLMTNAGAIHSHEAIDPHGTYTFVSTTGSITVILPSDASFHLDARTDTGTITTDFPGVMVTHRTNSAIHSTVGKPPHAKVRLRSDSGSIQLYGGPQENAQPLE